MTNSITTESYIEDNSIFRVGSVIEVIGQAFFAVSKQMLLFLASFSNFL
jgi:hypothetical protein